MFKPTETSKSAFSFALTLNHHIKYRYQGFWIVINNLSTNKRVYFYSGSIHIALLLTTKHCSKNGRFVFEIIKQNTNISNFLRPQKGILKQMAHREKSQLYTWSVRAWLTSQLVMFSRIFICGIQIKLDRLLGMDAKSAIVGSFGHWRI